MSETVNDILVELDDSTNEELEYTLIIETPEGSYQVDGSRWDHRAKQFVIEAGAIE